MGMFDYYEPDPVLACPACGAPLEGWQGKDGPCALFVWRQGNAAPVDQAVSDDIKGDAATESVPPEFEIYTQCCGGRFFVTAQCSAPEGVWAEAILETAANTRQRPHERRGDFNRRKQWLAGRAV